MKSPTTSANSNQQSIFNEKKISFNDSSRENTNKTAFINILKNY